MTDRQLAAALAGSAAASVAVTAPPISPEGATRWHWVVHTASLDLYADRGRAATTADLDGRLVLISGGGALHRARVALAADGVAARVCLLPDDDPDHLATITAQDRIEVTDEARALYGATERRRAERAPVAGHPPPAEAIAALVDAAAAQGVRLLVEAESDTVFGVLHGDEDTREAWLRAGEALSAVWLTARRHDLTVVPYPAAIRLPGNHDVIGRLLTVRATPYLAVHMRTSP